MKKLLACLLVVILAFGMTVATVSAATASPEAEGIVSAVQATDKNKEVVSFELEKIDGKVTQEFQNELKDLKKESGDNTLKVVAQYEAEIIGKPAFPIDVTLNVLGVSASSKVYVIVKEKSDVALTAQKNEEPKVITLSNVYNVKATTLAAANDNLKVFETKVENGKISFTLEKPIESLAIVADNVTATNVEKENNVVSPQTSDNTVMVAMIAILSLAFMGLVYNKVKA